MGLKQKFLILSGLVGGVVRHRVGHWGLHVQHSFAGEC